MAKRVFELAKELEVQSKAIVEKCQAEGLGAIKNHMSAVSAGLEATVREWFASEGDSATAVETAAKVDIEKVRAPMRARAKARPKDAGGESEGDSVAVEVSEAPEPAVSAGGVARAGDGPSLGEAKPAASVQASTLAARKATPTPPAREEDEVGASAERGVAGPGEGAGEESENGRAPGVAPAPMNVPRRPKVVTPRGPKLSDVKRPAKLSGPKVVRVEQAEVVDTPRRRPAAGPAVPMSRGPRGGAGAGFGPPPMPVEDDGRSRRNKRRGGG